ncbi:hypothetical protein PX52LOC_06680 [Limnoglobus roseus]|uniref:IS630 family transposase n=1 Tax=Limnoglobus roseus TaxID=2598579 RepID=A0A5C1AQY2_9BACT|nr:hypothetical protein PX52LOC_06680 [Limnoglobus roseus]
MGGLTALCGPALVPQQPGEPGEPLQPVRVNMAITEDRIRRGVFTRVPQLERAIHDYLAEHNTNPKPFVWTADADSILDRLKRVIQRTSDSGH